MKEISSERVVGSSIPKVRYRADSKGILKSGGKYSNNTAKAISRALPQILKLPAQSSSTPYEISRKIFFNFKIYKVTLKKFEFVLIIILILDHGLSKKILGTSTDIVKDELENEVRKKNFEIGKQNFL